MRIINDTKVGIGGIIMSSVVAFLVQFIIFDLSACYVYSAFLLHVQYHLSTASRLAKYTQPFVGNNLDWLVHPLVSLSSN